MTTITGKQLPDVLNIALSDLNMSCLDMEKKSICSSIDINVAADVDLSDHFLDCNWIIIINALLCFALPTWPNTIDPFLCAWLFLPPGIVEYSPSALLLLPLPIDENIPKASFFVPAQTILPDYFYHQELLNIHLQLCCYHHFQLMRTFPRLHSLYQHQLFCLLTSSNRNRWHLHFW